MSYLVSELFINPVLRQARRFSRPGAAEPAPLLIEQGDDRHEIAIQELAERMGSLDSLGATGNDEVRQIIAGEPLTSSPVEEIGGLEQELEALQAAGPARVGTLRSDRAYDEDISDNPLFGVPGRFRTASGTSFTEQNVLSARMSPAEGPSRSSTLDLSQSGTPGKHRNSSLPADDGMGALRRQIIAIQAMDTPADQKAQLMHQLLTRGYHQSQELYRAKPSTPSANSEGMTSQERPSIPGSLSSYIWQMNGAEDNAPLDQQHTFHLSPDDLNRTYAPPDPPEVDEDGVVRYKEDQVLVLGCPHYKRNVKLQCFTCERWHTCRLCHDEVEDHTLIRKSTKNMLCMLCGCAQQAGEECVSCGERTAWYYCGVCKLWDNDPNKNIYHCNDCGICRKGRGLGKDFFHCKTCGVCMEMAVEHSHKCIERVSDCDCPICGEYMFTSPRPVVFMLCGHSIHQACYYEHMKSSYKCPICSKSTVNMETQFRNLDRAIDSQPMPPQFQDTKAMVSCNDCYAKSAVKYHWLGLKCAICDSYNTAQLSILSDPAVEVPALEPREAEQSTPPTQIPRARVTPGPTGSTPAPGPMRIRRHSSHLHIPPSMPGEGTRFSPYPFLQRIGRSVSPVRSAGFFGNSATVASETDESGLEEGDLDFWGWGRDETRSVTTFEAIDENEGMEEDDSFDDDSISGLDSEEDGEEEEDVFELLGHR